MTEKELKELESLKTNRVAEAIATLMGVNLNDAVDEYIEDIKKKETDKCEPVVEPITESLERKVAEGKLVKEVRDGVTFYHTPDEVVTQDDLCEPDEEKGKEPRETASFIMSKQELKDFVTKYQELENIFRKLPYMYGIDLNGGKNSIYERYNTLVWALLEKIFGSDNIEDIADFCFGNSNFDSVEQLYEELV